jgi:DNA polymerase II large subunit
MVKMLERNLNKIDVIIGKMGDNILRDYLMKIHSLFEYAHKAREKHLDVKDLVESKLTLSSSERMEEMLNLEGLAERLKQLLKDHDRFVTGLKIAKEITLGKFGFFSNEKALELATKAALCIITKGVTLIPLIGITKVEIRKNGDGTPYPTLILSKSILRLPYWKVVYAIMVLDQVRKIFNLERFKIDSFGKERVEDFLFEVQTYQLQKGEKTDITTELISLLRNLPIQLEDETPQQVGYYRRKGRIFVKTVNNTSLTIIIEGIIKQHKKLLHLAKKLQLSEWQWLQDLHYKGCIIIPDYIVLNVGGKEGSFRLRLERNSNLYHMVVGVHPSVYDISEGKISPNSIILIDVDKTLHRVSFIETVEPPVVKLKNGDVVRLEEQGKVKFDDISEILFWGDLLYDKDFTLRKVECTNKIFTEREWLIMLENVLEKNPQIKETLNKRLNKLVTKPSAEEAFRISKELRIPLHPHYQYFWQLLEIKDIIELRNAITFHINERSKDVTGVASKSIKKLLERALIPHRLVGEEVIIEGEDAKAIYYTLCPDKEINPNATYVSILDFLTALSGVHFENKLSQFVGVVVKMPEKLEPSQITPLANVLFPVGDFYEVENDLTKLEVIHTNVANLYCERCGTFSYFRTCSNCGGLTKFVYYCEICHKISTTETCEICGEKTSSYFLRSIPIKHLLKTESQRLDLQPLEPLRGVKEIPSEIKTPEPLGKGIIRQYYALTIYKDSTIRYDTFNSYMITFRPKDIGVSITKLRKFGYEEDILGKPLESETQLVNLQPYDIIVPKDMTKFFTKVAKYVDELLVRYYEMEPYYKVESPDDLIGHLIVGITKTSSTGIIWRIIGHTSDEVCYIHPKLRKILDQNQIPTQYSYALLLDVLLNFSNSYIDPKEPVNIPIYIQPIIHLKKEPRFQPYHRHYINLKKNPAYEGALDDVNKRITLQLELLKKSVNLHHPDTSYIIFTKVIYPILLHLANTYTKQPFICTGCGRKFRRLPLNKRCPNCRKEVKPTSHLKMLGNIMYNLREVIKTFPSGKTREKLELTIENIEGLSKIKKQASILDFI